MFCRSAQAATELAAFLEEEKKIASEHVQNADRSLLSNLCSRSSRIVYSICLVLSPPFIVSSESGQPCKIEEGNTDSDGFKVTQ